MARVKGIAKLLFVYILIISLFLVGTIFGNKAVTALSEQLHVERHLTVIIDAGHGGEDGGASSCTGKVESGYNLAIAKRTDSILQLMGYKTRMIRTTDSAVYTKGETLSQKKISDLKNRVKTVNSTENGVLLSIHQNTFPEAKYSGAQVFYADTPGSEYLAKAMQKSLKDNLNPGGRREAKKGEGIYLLENISRCGVLVECGFISNPAEEAKLSTPDYQKKIAAVMGLCVCEYLSLS